MKLHYPPLLTLYGILAAVALGYYVPAPVALPSGINIIGIILIIAGIYPALAINKLFKQAETTIMPDRSPTALVEQGLLRYSRNPIYVGMALVITGVVLITGNIWGLVIPPIFMILVYRLWIRREEERLEAEFGDTYRDYKKRVRRWI